MSLVWPIVILVVIIAGMVLLRIFARTVYNIFRIVWLVIVVIGIIFGVLVYLDVNDLKENFPVSENLFVLDIDGNLEAGIVMRGEEEPDIIAVTEEMNEAYRNNAVESLLDGYYKVFVIKYETFNLSSGLDIQGMNFTEEEIYMSLTSEDPVAVFAGKVIEEEEIVSESGRDMVEQQVDEIFKSDEEYRGTIFGMLFVQELERQGAGFIVMNLKKDNIKVYEETIAFKLINYIPNAMIDSFIPRGEYDGDIQ